VQHPPTAMLFDARTSRCHQDALSRLPPPRPTPIATTAPRFEVRLDADGEMRMRIASSQLLDTGRRFASPAFAYDEENDLFRFRDGRFAFSCEHADWALLRKRGRLKGRK
jgi:hypothetical protein